MVSKTNEQALEASIEKYLTGTCLEELAAIRAVADYACENAAHLLELDVNPLLVGAQGTVAVDALIRLGQA